jgi:hypothetical protein
MTEQILEFYHLNRLFLNTDCDSVHLGQCFALAEYVV